MNKRVFILLALLSFVGCAQYEYAESVKLISFSDDIKKGKSAGKVEGEDCTWMLLGYWPGGPPNLDKAFMNTQNQSGIFESMGFNSGKNNRKKSLRYMNNVSTSQSGFQIPGIIGRQCLVVNGIGYR